MSVQDPADQVTTGGIVQAPSFSPLVPIDVSALSHPGYHHANSRTTTS